MAKALSIRLDVGDLPRVQGGTNNVEAYDKYLQARELYLQGGPILCQQAVQQLRASGGAGSAVLARMVAAGLLACRNHGGGSGK